MTQSFMSWRGFKGDIMKKFFLWTAIFLAVLKFGGDYVNTTVNAVVSNPIEQHIQGF